MRYISIVKLDITSYVAAWSWNLQLSKTKISNTETNRALIVP